MSLLTERYADKIAGTLSCYDRVVITGTLPDIGYARAMTNYLYQHNIRIFDFATEFAVPLRDKIRQNAEQIAAENGIEIDYVRRKNFRKEERVKAILAGRGEHPGLVHIFSALEPCTTYKPWHNKETHKTYMRPDSGKCLHYYFYFIHEELGLCYLRVPTWAPYRLQFYFNGHGHLARQLSRHTISYRKVDNAFVTIGDFRKAQDLADQLEPKRLHRILDRAAQQYCPVVSRFRSKYHWSIMQVEYCTDIVFRAREHLEPVYESLSRAAIHAVKADNVATFLGRKLNGNYEGELGSDFSTRIQGTRVKHQMGPVSIKMYDKLGTVLRIETTANDVSFFKHYRKVVHRDGSRETKFAAVRKSIYSLKPLRELLGAANRRYLEYISELQEPSAGVKSLEKLSSPAEQHGRSYRGFNLFSGDDLDLFMTVARGEFNISGFRNHDLRQIMKEKTGGQMSRMLKRLRLHGLIKKIGRTYKYYLTRLGRKVVLTALKLRELVIIPALAHPEVV